MNFSVLLFCFAALVTMVDGGGRDCSCPVRKLGCPWGWLSWGHSCYYFGWEPLSHDAAQSWCGSLHELSCLVNFETVEERDFMKGKVSYLQDWWGVSGYWIGAKQQHAHSEGSLVWADGSAAVTTVSAAVLDWGSSQPSDLEHACTAMVADWGWSWDDTPCASGYDACAICEIPRFSYDHAYSVEVVQG